LGYSEAALEPAENLCALYVDMGTTNTRAWLMRGDEVISAANRAVGVRDAARDGLDALVQNVLRDLIVEVTAKAEEVSAGCKPTYIAASGMITSSLGLAEVPHIQAPAGIQELAVAARWYRFPNVSDLPFLLVPGVHSGPANPTLDSVHECDVMRGEETLCAGLAALQIVQLHAVVLNLGSHWKAIRLDGDGRVRSSVTSLSGELIHVLQTQTILAGSVPNGRPANLSREWVDAAMREQRKLGLSRALFSVRLLDLAKQGTPEERLAFLVGAVVAADLDALLAHGVLQATIPVAVIGHQAIAETWVRCLSQASVSARLIPCDQVELALLTALRRILQEAVHASKMEHALHQAEAR
jgi:2-dehydro-3-deoxygalactonokinase